MNLADELSAMHADQPDGATFGATKFADLTAEEFAQRVLMTNYTRPLTPPTNVADTLNDPYPAELDWYHTCVERIVLRCE
jgi:hypothetical protein